MIRTDYPIHRGDYTRAGEASADIKRQLRQLGVGSGTLRRVAVAAYEMEMNIVIHSLGGSITMEVGSEGIKLSSQDEGPGIPDVEKAMSEGFSTADEVARGFGFGAGMGLPNMRRNADKFEIESVMGQGTCIRMLFLLS